MPLALYPTREIDQLDTERTKNQNIQQMGLANGHQLGY